MCFFIISTTLDLSKKYLTSLYSTAFVFLKLQMKFPLHFTQLQKCVVCVDDTQDRYVPVTLGEDMTPLCKSVSFNVSNSFLNQMQQYTC